MSADQHTGSGSGNPAESQDTFSMDQLFGSMSFDFDQGGILMPNNGYPSTTQPQLFPGDELFALARIESRLERLDQWITHLDGRMDGIGTRIDNMLTSLDQLIVTSEITYNFVREWRNQQNAAEAAIFRIFDVVADMIGEMRQRQTPVQSSQQPNHPAEEDEGDREDVIEEDDHDLESETCCEEDQEQ